MKTLLIAINAKYIHSNLAVYSLRASAGPWKEEVEIGEYTINHRKEDILADIYRRKPQIAAFSCYIWNLDYVKSLIRDLKQVLPQVEIWAGGPEVSYDGEKFLEELPEVRGVMYGEGESTFRELLEVYQDNQDFSPVKGIFFRCNGKIFRNPSREYENLDELPFVYEDLSTFEHRILYYESSRGCPFSCSYCLSSIEKKVRFRSLKLVKEELKFFLDRKVPQVKFVDRTFNISHSRTREIWSYLKEKDNGVTNFHFEISADILTDEEIELLQGMRPGLVQLEIGVQSTNPDTLQAIHRTAEFREIADKVERVKKARNVHQHLDLIAGLPYESMDRFIRSFNEVYALRPEQLQLGFLKVLKGSEMYLLARKFGVVYRREPPYEVLSTRWMSYEEILKLKEIEDMVEVYYNSSQFTRTMDLLLGAFPHAFALYEALADFYRVRGYFEKNHSRMGRLEILREFALHTDSQRQEEFESALLLDLYAREKSKTRPSWAGDLSSRREEIYEFYRQEAREPKYLKGAKGESPRRLMNRTHLEILPASPENWYLFDYERRDPLTHDALIRELRRPRS